MKKFIILSLLILPFAVKAQVQTEYNQKGDAAKDQKDYQLAMFWYEQGIPNCDRYSIGQLTAIWKADETMRASMRVVMGKCLLCLTEQGQGNDTIAIKQLIDYYSEGIGTVKNESNANYWKGQLERSRKPVTDFYVPVEPKERVNYFVGYHASMIAPFGIQVGGMGKSVGWYVRLRSNFAFQETQYDAEIVKVNDQNQLKIQQLDNEKVFYRATGSRKETNLMGSVGIMFKTVSNLHVSAGVGYWDRKYSREFVRVNDNGTVQASSGWARVVNNSKNGIMIDLDGTYIISGRFYGSLGGTLLNFNYVYPNIGIGIFF